MTVYKWLSVGGLVLVLVVGWSLTASAAFYGYCSKPSPPSCLDMLGISRDEFTFTLCQSEVDAYIDSVKKYIDCRIGEVQDESRELKNEVNRAIERFNCYAAGSAYCP